MQNQKNGVQPSKHFDPDPTPGEAAPSDALRKLREQWDTQLACLNEPGAADRLRSYEDSP